MVRYCAIQPRPERSGCRHRRARLSTRPAHPPTGSRPPSRTLGNGSAGHQESRRERNRKLIAKLNSLGVEITLEEVQVLGKHLTGRPHFAKVLLRKGDVQT